MRQILNSNSMFYVPFLHLKVWDWEIKKEKLLELIKSENFSKGERDNTTTDYHYLYPHQQENKQDPKGYTQQVQDILDEELNVFVNHHGLTKCEIVSSWFELSQKNQYHEVHNHGSTGFSSACFVDYDEDVHTPTKFIGPFLNFQNGNLIEFEPDNVGEGSIIFFPSSIFHYTKPNNDSKIRTILAFNLDCQ